MGLNPVCIRRSAAPTCALRGDGRGIRYACPQIQLRLNLATLKLKRPSIMEAPAECAQFTSRTDYISAWGDWCA